jgi:hypothetical protein
MSAPNLYARSLQIPTGTMQARDLVPHDVVRYRADFRHLEPCEVLTVTRSGSDVVIGLRTPWGARISHQCSPRSVFGLEWGVPTDWECIGAWFDGGGGYAAYRTPAGLTFLNDDGRFDHLITRAPDLDSVDLSDYVLTDRFASADIGPGGAFVAWIDGAAWVLS